MYIQIHTCLRRLVPLCARKYCSVYDVKKQTPSSIDDKSSRHTTKEICSNEDIDHNSEQHENENYGLMLLILQDVRASIAGEDLQKGAMN